MGVLKTHCPSISVTVLNRETIIHALFEMLETLQIQQVGKDVYKTEQNCVVYIGMHN